MSEKAAANSPPAPRMVHVSLEWLDKNVRKPLEGTWFDKWIATPAKKYYVKAKRHE